jgi:hypothetical protein
MASSGKKKTTMAKINRERKLRERRIDKQAKKDARKQASAHHPPQPGEIPAGPHPGELPAGDNGQPLGSSAQQPAPQPIDQSRIYT